MKRGVPLLFTVFAWLGLLKGLPEARPFFWFPACLVIAAVCLFLYLREKREEFAVAFLLTGLLLPSGVIQFLHLVRLSPIFFPLIIIMTFFFSLPAVLIALALFSLQIVISSTALGLPGLRTYLNIPDPVQAGLISAFLMMTAGVSSFMVQRLRAAREKAENSLATIRQNARSIARETELDSLSSEETNSHYFASMLKTDEEIRELLVVIRHAVVADSASLFVPDREEFILRCSTEEKGEIVITGGGVLSGCMKDRKTYSFTEIDEKKIKLGYMKGIKVLSVIAVPILEGSSLIGVLSVDSSRQYAFSDREKQTVELFAGQLVRMLERERIDFMMKRDHFSLRILREESKNLVTSLKSEVIGRKLCEGAEKISSAQVFFFEGEGDKYDLVHHNTPYAFESRRVSFDATVINFAIENRHRHYVSDMKGYPIRVMPFDTDDVRSVLAVPMLYEKKLMGVLVMLSEQVDFLDSFQINLIEVLCNQASTSIANAKLHAKIERLATTDGLTGLFNHRIFQERLTGELKRQSRISGPLSLMLTDIDFFKKVNDTYGHPVGDIVLKKVSKVIRESLRDIDIPARYGGEEFAVILPGTDGPGARVIAERLRTAVQGKTFSADEKSFRVSISIGIAVSPADAKRKEELIEKADQALYHAKHNGRNQSVLWSSIAGESA
ncbi:MAG: diguanylate cyclase [Thermodesulfovibrionales bacterium]